MHMKKKIKKTTIRLLPCSYSNSEEILEWLDAMSLHGYNATKITNTYAKFQKEQNRYYHISVNSVTEQYEFSNNGASSQGNIIQKQKDRGFVYVGKCGSYLFFQTPDIHLIEKFDTLEHHTEANTLAFQTQLIISLISIVCGWQMLKLWFTASLYFIPIEKYTGFALIFFLPIYAIYQAILLYKKSKDKNYMPSYKKAPVLKSSFAETLFRITILLIAAAVLVFSVVLN